MRSPLPRILPALLSCIALSLSATLARADGTLNVYIMAGQSNMVGHAYTYYNNGGDNWNIPSLEFLLDDTPQAVAYRNTLSTEGTHTFLPHLDDTWLNSRDDVWGVHYQSDNGSPMKVIDHEVPNPATNPPPVFTSGVHPLSPGFGGNQTWSAFGPELGFGQRIGKELDNPVLLFKSATGGTTLGVDWRSPDAVAARGGNVGVNYTNTMNRFSQTLDALDADLADDGVLNDYNNATDYKVVGFVWVQGWNEQFNEQGGTPTAAQLQAEYDENLVDLVNSIRSADPRIAADMGTVIVESSDQNNVLNIARQKAVDELNAATPGSAVFIETNNMIGRNWGVNNNNQAWTTQYGFHFNSKAENYLELGWRAGEAAIANGFYVSGSPVPEPTSVVLLGIGALLVAGRLRSSTCQTKN